MDASSPLVPTRTDVRGTHLEVAPRAARENAAAIRRHARAGALVAVVKANAYGIGASIVAPAVADEAAVLAVVTVEEGAALRALGITKPILVLGAATWVTSPETLFALELMPLVSSLDELDRLEGCARAVGRHLPIHVGLDTGMAREGFPLDDDDALRGFVSRLGALPGLVVAGVMTHFAHADLAVPADTEVQVARFARALDVMLARGLDPGLVHVANSACALRHGARPFALADARFDPLPFAVRPGIALLGVSPFPDEDGPLALAPVFRLRAPVVLRKAVPPGTRVSYGGTFTAARPTELALLGLGYADGYPRALSNRGAVRFAGQLAPVVGRVCMDLVVVDVTDVVAAGHADAVAMGAMATVMVGRAQDALAPWRLAAAADTIAYEITNRLSARVARVPVAAIPDEGVAPP